ncbi:hypothetical protein ABIE65_004164 [Constrictibacter sp. MBR-5]
MDRVFVGRVMLVLQDETEPRERPEAPGWAPAYG